VGPRVRWGGVMSGVVMALGIVLLLTALGLAIGLTAVGDPRVATAGTATGLGIGTGLWAAITLLVAYFLGGLVSTMVTDRPDRGGALVHGAMVWTLVSGFLLWLLGQGISLGSSGLLGGHSRLVGHVCRAGAHAGYGHPGGAGGDSESAHLAYPVDTRRQRVTTGELRGVISAVVTGNALLVWAVTSRPPRGASRTREEIVIPRGHTILVGLGSGAQHPPPTRTGQRYSWRWRHAAGGLHATHVQS
jgi:hypothetical protein